MKKIFHLNQYDSTITECELLEETEFTLVVKNPDQKYFDVIRKDSPAISFFYFDSKEKALKELFVQQEKEVYDSKIKLEAEIEKLETLKKLYSGTYSLPKSSFHVSTHDFYNNKIK